jgi:transcription termination factor Rho
MIRRAFNGVKSEEAVNQVLDLFAKTRNNGEFVSIVKKQKWLY